MRIVNQQPHPSVVKECICRHCGVTLEYIPADVVKGYETDYTGSRDSYKFITCMNCHTEIRVS